MTLLQNRQADTRKDAELYRMVNLMEAAYLAIAFVVYVVVVAIGGSVLTGVLSTQTANSAGANATSYGLTGISNLAQQSGVIGTVIGAVVLIGLIMGAFMVKR